MAEDQPIRLHQQPCQCRGGGNLNNFGINCLGLVIARWGNGKVMRTFVVSTFTLLLLTSVAFPQQGREAGETPSSLIDKQDAAAARAAVERQKQRELDAQYKASLGTMKKPIAPSDPWGDVRSAKNPRHRSLVTSIGRGIL